MNEEIITFGDNKLKNKTFTRIKVLYLERCKY